MVPPISDHSRRPLIGPCYSPDHRIVMAHTRKMLRLATRYHTMLPAGFVILKLLLLLAVTSLFTACQAQEPPEISSTAPALPATLEPVKVPALATPISATPAVLTKEPSAPPTTTPLISPIPSTEIVVVQAPNSISPGDTATVIARVPSGTSCSLQVRYQDSSPTSQEFAPIQSETPGLIAWSWQVGPQAPRGTWPLTIMCGDLSASVSITVR